MKKSMTLNKSGRSTILLVAILSVLIIGSCQKEDTVILNAEVVTEAGSPLLKSVDVTNYLMDLIQTIENMVVDGLISEGNANALIVKINNASKSLEKGNNIAFDGQLSALINTVESFVADGTISEEEGEMIINKAETGVILSKGSFIDERDGNEYSVVLIGEQLWMAENLRATKYNDGTDIPLVIDNTAWLSSITPAYCWYNNSYDTYGVTYGALYNWYSVNTGKLAPQGWHVPSDEEWSTLISYLGGNSVAGGKLKESGTLHWNSPNIGATNETGFAALPGGLRGVYNGGFYQIPWVGFWWSTMEMEENSTYAWNYYMSSYNPLIIRNRIEKGDGLSVRCLRD